ncbi:hypothetical protein GPJ56_004828 [Histomonas meleagridis]|uniref:uncharacterized protein n=1 Tax=Histomonas meleagridis TaxID=135588 RepID=UPI00355A1B7C|nr:hypothetical protein GPJ56_004828 [Histomonas meleagridis]KAH0803479.1 hypothetical protein GO595_003823 [Histomonas meleagridis]
MGKVNLNKKNKSDKNADFKRRKSNLGHGKHKHLSHTKIDLQTARLRVPTQQKFENVEEEPSLPNIQQLNDLILLCHSDNDKKVISGLTGLLSFLPRATDLFLPKISEILASILHHLRHPDPKVREHAQNLISWIMNRFAQQCSPFASLFVRHISAQLSNPNPSIKSQSAFLLEKIASLPNLQPIPSLFELFPLMIKYAMKVEDMIIFTKVISKVMLRFTQTKENTLYHSYKEFTFPNLFPPKNATFSYRLRPQCSLGTTELESIDLLLVNLTAHFELIGGDDQSEAISCICNLLNVVYQLDSKVNLDPFLSFISERFPYEEGTLKQNINIAKFLLKLPSAHEKIREFLSSIPPSPNNLVLFASLDGCDFNIPEFAEAIPEICNAQISDTAAPMLADALLESILTEEKTTKRTLNVLISLKKSDEFQKKLVIVLREKLLQMTPTITELLTRLITSCAPLERGFLREFSEFLLTDQVSDELCLRCIEAITITNGITDESALLSFLMTMGAKRPSIREYVKKQIKRLEILTEEESKHLYSHIDLNQWVIV